MAREREHPQPMAAVRATLEEHEGFIIAKIQYVSQDLFLKIHVLYNYSLLLSYPNNPCIFGFFKSSSNILCTDTDYKKRRSLLKT